MGILASVLGNGLAASRGVLAEDTEFRAAYPYLSEMLMAGLGEDGKPRQTSTYTCLCEDGVWKIGVHERDLDASLWVSSQTHAGALDALEGALHQTPVAWRKRGAVKRYGGKSS